MDRKMDPARLILGDSAKDNISSKMCFRAQYWRVCQQKDTNAENTESQYIEVF